MTQQYIQNILLVEDSPSQALSLKTVLEIEGLTVKVATDGPEAIEQAHTNNYDLIVLDVELPTLNGYETCRRLKVSPDTADIPIIMFTSHDRPADTLTALEMGVVDYIPKDVFAAATLVGTIRRINAGDKL